VRHWLRWPHPDTSRRAPVSIRRNPFFRRADWRPAHGYRHLQIDLSDPIEGQTLSADITQEITSFVFEDNEEELDVLELAVTDRNLKSEIGRAKMR
jgi:hypothetical protein